LPIVKGPRSGAQSLDRAVGLINLIAQHHDQGIALSDLVQAAGLDRTTVWRMVENLQHAGLIEKNTQTGAFVLGPLATAWGAASFGQSALIRQCQPVMKNLARASGDNVFLVLRMGDYSHCLHLEQGAHAVRSFRQTVGENRLLGLGVGSIAMLAALPDEAVDAHHTRHMESYSQEGVTRAQLLRWVRSARQRGFAYRNTAGIAAVGLHGVIGGVAVAALSIGAAAARLPLSRATEWADVMRRQVPQAFRLQGSAS
jgi:DNA-binding IclR family transcriptional regulator